MPLQWLACAGYGVELGTPMGENQVYPLVTMPDYANVDPSALEIGIQEDFLVKRVVGQIFRRFPDEVPLSLWGWRLLALPLDLSTGLMQVPWAVTDSPLLDPNIANEPRWWAERWYQVIAGFIGEQHGLNVIDNPWWTHVDIRPGELCGPGQADNWYPCLCVDNTQGNVELFFQHRLRMLVETQGRR